MREYKFRAWDKENKKMLYVDEENGEYWNALPILPDCGFSLSGGVMWGRRYANKFELMQYVGITDKNRKEIYEGDIIKRQTKRTTEKYEIEYQNGSYFIASKSYGVRLLYDNLEISPEVIGNIYENPDLIKE